MRVTNISLRVTVSIAMGSVIRPQRWTSWLFFCWSLIGCSVLHAEQYLSREDFLSKAFGDAAVQSKTLWLSAEQKKIAQQILGHPYKGLRIRYWASAKDQTAWVLEAIGKERPIQIGVVIQSAEIKNISILAFQESRGWEVRFPFFTEQFNGVSLAEKQSIDGRRSKYMLDKHIDGITGATLSVKAVTNTAKFALYLQRQHQETDI